MNDNLLIELTPAEVSIIKQSLRAESDRMVKQGYTQLSKLALETNNRITDALLDKNLARA
jgi:DNA-binding transcriptional regulator PaaX